MEDLFFNVTTRRKSLRSASEELRRVLEVVERYAIHYGGQGIGFSCKTVELLSFSPLFFNSFLGVLLL